jgi:hypothetical protein
MTKLGVEESKKLEKLLNEILLKLGYSKSFRELKYNGPAES